ncbi:MAG: RNA 2',3'-cyclic phosphodiesterase [Xanthobacteraceae bacterium]
MPRLFTGLEIPSDIGQTLSSLRGGLPGARWIDPENYHVTLRFIGDIDGVVANDIASTLFRVNRKPFEVALKGLAAFGGKKPRAVVAAVAPSRPLMELQAELERLMQRVGLDPEGRKFTPHVTLARLRDASNQDVADYLSVRGYFPTRVFTASRFVLFSSRSSVGGGPYIVEDSYALTE